MRIDAGTATPTPPAACRTECGRCIAAGHCLSNEVQRLTVLSARRPGPEMAPLASTTQRIQNLCWDQTSIQIVEKFVPVQIHTITTRRCWRTPPLTLARSPRGTQTNRWLRLLQILRGRTTQRLSQSMLWRRFRHLRESSFAFNEAQT